MIIDDPYKVLGVSPDASDDEIKQAYRRLAKKYHPDRNPGDEEAAKKMQEVNAAYEQIKNPDAFRQPTGGYNPYGSYGGYSQQSGEDQYQQAAYQYIRFGRFQEAINALQNATVKNARWYYLSALANNGLGNQVTALEHIRRAVSMEPNNPNYLHALDMIQNGGAAYRQQADHHRGFQIRTGPCSSCLCSILQMLCCMWCCCGY